MLLQTPSVIDEIGLQPKQRERLKNWSAEWNFEVLQEVDRKLNELMQLGQVEQVSNLLQQVRTERIAQAYADLEQILNHGQILRLKQIDAQVSGIDLFTRIDICKELKLADAQIDLLEKLTHELAVATSALRLEYAIAQSRLHDSANIQEKEHQQKAYARAKRRLHDNALIEFIRSLSKEQRILYGDTCGSVVNVSIIRREMGQLTFAS